MLSVIQLVTKATVRVRGTEEIRYIKNGLVVYLGVSTTDSDMDVDKFVNKLLKLRIFQDQNQKMNLSILDTQGEIMLISQFTLLGDLRGNNRPNFTKAADKPKAAQMYEAVGNKIRSLGVPVTSGFFGEHMEIEQSNDGPVTIILDTISL